MEKAKVYRAKQEKLFSFFSKAESSFVLAGEWVEQEMKRGKLESKQTEIESQKKAGRKRKQEKRMEGQGSVPSSFFCFSSS